jgi:very-short-patch-repair endonuclease
MPNGVDAPAWRVHILVPHGQRRQNIEYVRISRTTRLPEPVLRYGLKLAPPARAALDACSWCLEAPDDVTAEAFVETVVRATVSAGLADLDDLESELEQAPRRHTRSLRQALERARVRERALASRRLFEGLGYTSALGLMRRVAIYGERKLIAVAEALWPHRALVLTIDAEPNAVAELTRLGFAVIQLSAHDVADNTAEIMERIAAVLAARPEATLPRGVALLPLGQHESDAAAEGGGLPGRVQLASTTSPTLPPWSGLRVRGPAFSGAF